ncbi:yippee zinc-binding/DNA-binding /Mis18, centromere assembly-domain-containing protein [Biscogniauxia sp. FL1348]|nr:yippee zinc-binding/DNA-binding /Mis18, centromere assembly-domain-containing protein [Biscogniauxia sp. FL1348]
MLSMMLNEVPPLPPPAVTTNAGPKFPVYLLPSFARPFRRRRRSSLSSPESPTSDSIPSLSNSPTESTSSRSGESPPTPSLFTSRFSLSKDTFRRASVDRADPAKLARTQPDTLRCSTCGTDFGFCSQIVSKGFTGRYGRAYLVSAPENRQQTKTSDLINIKVGKPETRLLVTGSHVVADITCAVCYAKVGWKYVDAKEESQRYKVGKFILETQRVVDFRSWEDVMVDEMPELEVEQEKLREADDDSDPIVFDSEDEDECEDLFSGQWDAEVVAKRRSRKVNRRPKQPANV